jgi:hypothetical protein
MGSAEPGCMHELKALRVSFVCCLFRLVEDTAWHPVGKAELQNWSPTQRAIFKIFLGSPLKLWASVGHWWLWHFNLDLYTPKQRPRVCGGLSRLPAPPEHCPLWLHCKAQHEQQ